MIGLALEGGGVKGSYQAGVALAFSKCRVKIDGVCGTSIGAINAAFIASGDAKIMPKIWKSLDIGSVFGFSKEYVDTVNNHQINLGVRIKSFNNIIKNRGIELSGVKKILDKYLDVDKLYNSKIDFGLVTIRLKDLKPMYLWKSDIPRELIKEYMIASCSLPIFRPERIIDNSYYLDGGFYDNGPVNMMLLKGYDKVYLVKVHGIGITRKFDSSRVIVIESKRNLGRLIELNPKKVEENILMGYYDTIRELKNLDGYLYVFKKHRENYYRFLNRKVNKSLYRRVSNFFKTDTYRETTIKALEYIMARENINYYNIYRPKSVIKHINNKYNNQLFIYKYVRSLK